MKRVIAYFVSGMRTGSFFYLCLVLLSHVYPNIVYPAVNVRNIPGDLFDEWDNGGSLTFILEEEEFLTYSLRVILHLVVTATILALTYLFFGWGAALRSPIPWLIFLAIYGLIWLYQIWQLHKKTQRINQALLHRRKGK